MSIPPVGHKNVSTSLLTVEPTTPEQKSLKSIALSLKIIAGLFLAWSAVYLFLMVISFYITSGL